MVDPAARMRATVVRPHPVRVAQLFVVTVAYIALLPAAESWLPRLNRTAGRGGGV